MNPIFAYMALRRLHTASDAVLVRVPFRCDACGHTAEASTLAAGTAVRETLLGIGGDAATLQAESEAKTVALEHARRYVRLAKCPRCHRSARRPWALMIAFHAALGAMAATVSTLLGTVLGMIGTALAMSGTAPPLPIWPAYTVGAFAGALTVAAVTYHETTKLQRTVELHVELPAKAEVAAGKAAIG